MQAKREERAEKAMTRVKDMRLEAKEKYSYLTEKNIQRGKLVTEVKLALKEDVDQKKEISLLKKKDQIENYERGKNFHQLYKQKLVERILEKKERAERVVDQKKKIANMIGTQRVQVNRTFSQTANHVINANQSKTK